MHVKVIFKGDAAAPCTVWLESPLVTAPIA